MSIVQWRGIVSATFIGQTAAFWAAQVIGKRRAKRERGPTLAEMLVPLKFEPADDCGCEICTARRRKQAEARAN